MTDAAGNIGNAIGLGIGTVIGVTMAGVSLKSVANMADSMKGPEPARALPGEGYARKPEKISKGPKIPHFKVPKLEAKVPKVPRYKTETPSSGGYFEPSEVLKRLRAQQK